jgi:hypothetical protein
MFILVDYAVIVTEYYFYPAFPGSLQLLREGFSQIYNGYLLGKRIFFINKCKTIYSIFA